MIRHILKDGTRVDSIEGMVIKYEENKSFYKLLDEMNKRRQHGDEPNTAA